MRADRQRTRLEREVVVPALVIGSLVFAIVAGVATGVERPYPGYALGSGLVLLVERAMVVWAAALLVLVVGDKALRGRLPDEIGGRGVRYAAQEQLDEVAGTTAEVGDAIMDRLGELEAAFDAFERRSTRHCPHLLCEVLSSYVRKP